MKKLFVFLIVFSLLFLSHGFANKNLFSHLKNEQINFNVLSVCDDSFLIEFNSVYLDEFLSSINLQNRSSKIISDRVIIEGYSSLINVKSLNINNKKINTQISIFEDKVMVGCPLIYNSF